MGAEEIMAAQRTRRDFEICMGVKYAKTAKDAIVNAECGVRNAEWEMGNFDQSLLTSAATLVWWVKDPIRRGKAGR